MKTHFFLFLHFWPCLIVLGQKTDLDSEENIRLSRFLLKDLPLQIFGRTSTKGSRNLQEARKHGRVQDRISDDEHFPCNVSAGRSKSVPTSVHKLRPGDIDVIGAMGDSLTAGSGMFATNIFHVLIENRGAAATGGGQGTWRDFLTLPNIIKEFNPNLIGYALHDSTAYEEASEFNVAEPAAVSEELPFMTEILVHRIKSHPKVDVKNQWKLISIFMGSNDFCLRMCYLSSGPWSILESHKAELVETLRILKKKLPRTLVLLIVPPNLNIFMSFKNRPLICEIVNLVECPCLMGLQRLAQRDEFIEIMTRWQQIDEEVASYPEFQTEDFAVVAQTMSTNLTFPTTTDGNTDWRYLSVDCFHLSQLANARAAVGIWKNMLEPVGEKTRDWEEAKTIECPTESRPYIATAGNS